MSENKIWDLPLEVKALRTVLTDNPYSAKMYGFLKPEHFHFKVTKVLFSRLQEVMVSLDSFPSWRMLVTDSQLESGVQAALQDEFEKSAEATNTGDFDYLVKNLADLANKRAIYATVFDTQEALYNPEKSARDIASEMTSAITKLEHDDVMSELNMGVEYNELAEQILHETLFGDNTKNRIPSGFKSFDTESLGFQRGNLVCLGATSGSGKCADFQTLVPTTAGLLPIGDIHRLFGAGDGWSIPQASFAVVTREGLKPVEGIYKGYDSTLQIETNWGDKFRGTEDHKILCLVGGELDFKRLVDIKVGDWIPKEYNAQVFSCSEYPLDIAEVFGLYIAEGCKDFGFTNYDRDLHDCLLSVTEKYFDIKLTLCKEETVTLLRGAVKTFIGNHCGTVTSAYKTIPEIILRSDKMAQAAFIRGLFEGDGTIYLRKSNKKLKKRKKKTDATWYLELDSLSEKLIYQTKALLENMGILSSVREKKAWATNGSVNQVEKKSYSLSVNRSSFKEFYGIVGFISERKLKVLREAIDHLDAVATSSNSLACGRENKIPTESTVQYLDRLREVCKGIVCTQVQGTRWKDVTISYPKPVGEWHCFKRNTSAQKIYKNKRCSSLLAKQILENHLGDHVNPKVREVVEKDEVLNFLRLRIKNQLNYTWAQVTKITEHEEKIPVFDLSVRDKREYSASGVMSHNSQMALNLMTRQYLMGYDVVMASYEMGYEEIMHREFALISEVAHKKIKSQKMTAEEKRIVECSFREFNLKGKKNGNGFWLACPNSQNTVTEIGMRYMTRKPTCIIFDYINLLKSSHSKQTDAQWQMLGDIAKEAKVLARRMNCVVYLLIQIDKEHNLRYSQAIKDHADWIWGWVYDEDAKMNGFVNVKQIKARSAACYDFQLVTRFDVSQFRDPEEEDKKLSYTEAQYQAILAESRQYGSLFDLFKESVTVPKPINLNAKFPVDLTAKSPVDISGVRKTPARSYVSEDA